MRVIKSAIVVLIGIFGLVQSSPTLAWGPDGHEFIATAARDRLAAINPEAARTFNWLTREDSFHVSGLEARPKRDRAPQMLTCRGRNLREIASWPDCIRYMKAYSRTANFHFDDISRCVSTAPANPPPDRTLYCKDGNCGSDALPRYIAQLKDKGLSRTERARALAWVIHIVGDLHQPLHTIDNGDAGGNSVTVSLAAGAIPASPFTTGKFHSLWDTPMVVAAVGSGASAISRIEANADAHASDPSWQSVDVIAWSAVSHELARGAYDRLPQVPGCGAGEAEGGTIGSDYVSFFGGKVETQLSMAALRLSIVLENALR